MEYRYNLDDRFIAKEIKAARLAARLTQAGLAREVNLSTNTIAKIEANIMHVSLQTLVLLANALDMDINYLLSARKDADDRDENIDILFENLIEDLPTRDKAFLIRVMDALKVYRSAEGEAGRADVPL